MPEKIILAHEAVYVSEANPETNYLNAGRIEVGFSEYCTTDCILKARPAYRFETIGLLQFLPFELPEGSRILNARLHLFVNSTRTMTSCIQIYPNAQPFDGSTVSWETKPVTALAPVSVLLVKCQDQCSYVTCDITQLVTNVHKGHVPGFGVSLVADRGTLNTVRFCSDKARHPVYASIEYDMCCSPPCPVHAQTVENIFYEHIFEEEAAADAVFTQSIQVANAQTITFFVKNTGTFSFNFNLQISPDGIDFSDDQQMCTLQANEIKSVTPYLFAKYMRACIRPVLAGGHVKARIWCQMQTLDYTVKDQFSN